MSTSEKFSLYTVRKKYIRNLQNIDKRVPSVSPQTGKSTRIFLGIIVMINGQKYCIPFSSNDKRKYLTIAPNITLKKISQNNKLIAVLNINNMIPVLDKYLVPVDIKIKESDSENTIHRKNFYQYELDWCNQHKNEIEKAEESP